MQTSVKIHDSTGAACPVQEQRIVHLTPPVRILRALKLSGLFFLAALLTAPIPVIHLFTIPTGIMGGFLSLYFGYKTEFHIQRIAYKCARCATKGAVEGKYVSKDYHEICPSCREQLKFRLTEPASAT